MREKKAPEYDYAEDPYYFKQVVDKLGVIAASEMMGYSDNSIRQMADGRRQVRRFVEFACEQYIESNNKKASEEKLYVFISKPDSQAFNTLKAVADAVGITFQSL